MEGRHDDDPPLPAPPKNDSTADIAPTGGSRDGGL
jgi:hypothetical protein